MKNYLFPLILFISFSSHGQKNFKAEIDEHRVHYKKEFTNSDYSPFYHQPKAMESLHFYGAKKKYKVMARVELVTGEDPFQIKTYSGIEKTFKKYAWIYFSIKGKEYKLALYQNVKNLSNSLYRDLLFLPFKDITNSAQTYGGGRYIDLKIQDIVKDQVEIDFNKCYNPYCAYSDGYNCPIPPIENHLNIKIPAGEKMYTGPKLQRQQ